MEAVQDTVKPCYSARLVPPFAQVLRETGKIPKGALAWLEALDPDERVLVASVHTMLETALQLTGDPLLGIKAVARSSTGDVGIFDFVMSSARTLREALENAGRYMRLLNDTLEFVLEVEGERAVVRFENSVALPIPAEDYQTCALIWNQRHSWPEGMLDDMDVWFRHAAPAELDEYRKVLGSARLHFEAPRAGFGFPRELLDAPLRSRDPQLHELLRRYADQTLASLPHPESVTDKVRARIAEQLAAVTISMDDVAHQLRMSSRTLGRRLAEEGTTFKKLVDDARRSIALQYVAGHDLGLSEVALLAGFT
ncbi:MAG TPA: AraC family transcriptional regulator ligand-binding domain-containing protein, partial [Polyangiaceae bacterium]|nr:AraC family transcriptional regulator ligand-binding domain-containing protein [Polyangiaceae bacterium]